MARVRRPRGILRAVIILVAAGVIWLLEQRGLIPSTDGQGRTATEAPAKTGRFETLTGCRLQEHRGNDGDSFHVRLPDGRVEQFRLYFVDAPESQFRTYRGGATNHERIRQQAQAFGVTDEQAVEIGGRAKKLVGDLLGRGYFTVQTRWDDPFGDRRYHAFVTPQGGVLLEETLVSEGLARIHTKPADLPDGTPAKQQTEHLRRLEKEAKAAGRGAWGL